LSADRAILIVPYGHDPLDVLAAHLLTVHQHELPDLTQHAVLLPSGGIPRFQRTLLRRTGALLPPAVMTLQEWLRPYTPNPRQLSTQQQELLFFDILNRFPALKAQYGTWPLIDGLLALFDQITLNARELPPTITDLERRLARGYGLPSSHRLGALSQESHLVHSLYRAWHDDLNRMQHLGTAAAQVSAMRASIDRVRADHHLYIAGMLNPPRAVLDWLTRLPCTVTLVLQGDVGAQGYHPDSVVTAFAEALKWPVTPAATPDDRTAYLNTVFASDDKALLARATHARTRVSTNPLADQLSILRTSDAEQEARAIDLQVRRWWLAGKRDIGVVSNDRKLLRRVRALLERAQLPVVDRGGWPLSTTSAASFAMDWLSCLSTGFAPEPLLDFLRSPFTRMMFITELRDNAMAALEHALVNARAARGGLEACVGMLDRRTPEVVDRFGTDALSVARQVVTRLRASAAPPIALQQRRTVSHAQFCRTLNASLESLGVVESYGEDEAGNQLLALLDELTLSAAAAETEASWEDCAHWLRRAFERRHFRPLAAGAGVELTSMSESGLAHYEALALAGCTSDHLPGANESPPFFNDAVRAELGLGTYADVRNVQFNTFRRLLQAAPQVLLTYREQDGTRPLTVSPWLERLQAFHAIAFGDDAADRMLASLLTDPKTVLGIHDAPRPPAAIPPHPVVPPALVPPRLTPSAYRSLVDCPYQFYTRAILRLERPRPLEEDLTPADYGMLVHRCLQAFHAGVPGVPGPWQGALTEAGLPAARALLDEIAEAVFAPHLRRTITTRAWLYRWRRVVNAYLHWQMERQRTWPVTRCEQTQEHTLLIGERPLQLYGRIDRIDEAGEMQAIVDYKTGTLPKRDEVMQGEHVQLPFYALLNPAAREARLLGFEDNTVRDRLVVADQDLHTLVTQHAERLARLFDDIAHGAPLPAHGDPETCDRCDVATLCRRPLWRLAEETADAPPDTRHG